MKQERFGATALLIATFLVGGLAGGVMVHVVADRGHGPREGRRGGHFERLVSELHLTAVQQDSVQAIFARSEAAADSLWREIRPAFAALREHIRNEIRGQLTPEQQRIYQAMIERQDREYQQRDRERGNRGAR